MPENPNPTPDEARELALNRAIKRVSSESRDREEWPDEDAIVAFIHGDATVDQRDDVEEALARSSAFRRFVVDLAELLREPASAESQRAFDKVRVPILTRVRQQYQSARRTNFWSPSVWLRPRVLAPAFLAAAAVILLLQIDWFGPKDDVGISRLEEHSQLDPSVFASFSTRGTTEAARQIYFHTADSAAIGAFRQVLSYDWMSGSLEIAPSADSPSTGDEIQVHFLDSLSRQLGRVTLALPGERDMRPDVGAESKFWVFSLESHRLSNVSVDIELSAVAIVSSGVGTSLATVTIRTPDGYQASAPRRIQITP